MGAGAGVRTLAYLVEQLPGQLPGLPPSSNDDRRVTPTVRVAR